MGFADSLAAQLTTAPADAFARSLEAALAGLAAQQLSVQFHRDDDGLTHLVEVVDIVTGRVVRTITPHRDADGLMVEAVIDIH